ncbi:class I SAM-dependent methyltransferase [Sphingomonas sp. GB1N7]|uniref:class I SAM-dependent methyltransferase n=1 Tax=Parasphingomonas caseinilytica TaxID=3096158 RepID=UPI002FCC6517
MIGPPTGTRVWLDRFVMPLPRGGTVLDLGCGAGEPIARYLVDRGLHVVGMDYDRHAVELAATRFPRQRWLHGDMRTFTLDETFEGVLAWNCLSVMGRVDQGRMAARAAAWLKPGGRLLFNAEPDTDSDITDYRSGSPYRAQLGATDYETAMVAQGLITIAHVEQDPDCDGAGIWLARKG